MLCFGSPSWYTCIYSIAAFTVNLMAEVFTVNLLLIHGYSGLKQGLVLTTDQLTVLCEASS